MLNKLYRNLKYQYLKLLRTKGAPSIIARSFALGIFIEFITLPTLGIAFLFLYPLNVLLRGNLAASLIGFIMGKFILPLFFVINLRVGTFILNGHSSTIQEAETASIFHLVKTKGIAFFLGSGATGLIVGVLCYFIVFSGLIFYRKQKNKKRIAMQIKSKENLAGSEP
jgi:uncharacterized protein (DUF2062 family)